MFCSTLRLALLPLLKALLVHTTAPEHVCKSPVNLPLPFEVLIPVHTLYAKNLGCERVSIPELRRAYSCVVLRRETEAKLGADVIKQKIERLCHCARWAALFHAMSNVRAEAWRAKGVRFET